MRVEKKVLRAYLSGGMEHAWKAGAGWRAQLQRWIKKELQHQVFNPVVVSEKYLERHYPGTSQKRLKWRDLPEFQKLVSALVLKDCREIATRTDYVICLWDRSAARGAGTKGELTMAKFFGKPVYVVTSMKQQEIPGWILGCTTRLFSDFDQLKSFLISRYNRKRN